MPPWSVRMDPFNWLLEGRLGLELEVGLLNWLSVEFVPVFVVNDQPPAFNFSGREDPLTQESNGLGRIVRQLDFRRLLAGGQAAQGLRAAGHPHQLWLHLQASDDVGMFDQVCRTPIATSTATSARTRASARSPSPAASALAPS